MLRAVFYSRLLSISSDQLMGPNAACSKSAKGTVHQSRRLADSAAALRANPLYQTESPQRLTLCKERHSYTRRY